MRKTSVLLSILVLAAMVLTACGGGATSTNVASSPPPITAEVTATEEMSATATEMPTEGTAGIPVTGDVNPASVSNQLDFTVWNQDGEQIGEVDDMVLDLDSPRVAYVVVGTGGFLDLGEREILVPWDSLQLQTGTGDTTGGQQNAFILQTDQDTFSNAPDFDLNNLPQFGQSAGDWDADLRNYWQGGGAVNPPTQSGTAVPDTTATVESTGSGTGLATATAGTGTDLATATAGTGTGTGLATATAGTGTSEGTGQGMGALQGVVLASDVLGSTVTFGMPGQGTGQGLGLSTATPGTGDTSLATATPGTGTNLATATPSTGAGLATATAGTGTGTDLGTATTAPDQDTSQGSLSATVDDIIVDTASGEFTHIVVNTSFDDGEHWIPVPLSLFQLDGNAQTFVLNADTVMLQNAPFFQDGQFPDTTLADWSSEFDAFWQSGGTGTGSGSGATATTTP